jgi:hypothetical protein
MPADTAGFVNLCVSGNLVGKTSNARFPALNSPVSCEEPMAGNQEGTSLTEGNMFVVCLKTVAITLLRRSELHANMSPSFGKRGAQPAASSSKKPRRSTRLATQGMQIAEDAEGSDRNESEPGEPIS